MAPILAICNMALKSDEHCWFSVFTTFIRITEVDGKLTHFSTMFPKKDLTRIHAAYRIVCEVPGKGMPFDVITAMNIPVLF
jgi:hypothetical protein